MSNVDALHTKILTQLTNFLDWCDRNGVKAFIGEIGWLRQEDEVAAGDSARWNTLAAKYLDVLDARGVSSAIWTATALYNTDFVSYYTTGQLGTPRALDAMNSQAATCEAHPGTASVLRGISLTHGLNGSSTAVPAPAQQPTFSDQTPGVLDMNNAGTGYNYGRAQDFAFLGGRAGAFPSIIRQMVKWERIMMPGWFNGIRVADRDAIITASTMANNNGAKLLLCIANMGYYYKADAAPPSLTGYRHQMRGWVNPDEERGIPGAAWVELWKQTAAAFIGNSNIWGYDLMNEPYGVRSGVGMTLGPQGWEQYAQMAVTAIRNAGDTHPIVVEGYDFSPIDAWPGTHLTFINDPLDKTYYSPHHYWPDVSQHVGSTYATLLQNAINEGWKA
jgi:hypothetical protein